MNKSQPSLAEQKSTLTHCLGKFVFLIHPTKEEDLVNSINPSILSGLTPDEKVAFEEWVLSCGNACDVPGVVYHMPAIPSAKVPGGYAEGWLVGMTQTPEKMMRLGKKARTEMIEECITIAKGLGADVLGLGAFTSIITHNGLTVADCGLHVTSGNGLTAMSAAFSLEEIARNRGDVNDATQLGIVGAAGSVGRLASLRLAKTFSRITLFGNPVNRDLNKMQALAGEIYQEALARTGVGATSGIAGALMQVRSTLEHKLGGVQHKTDADSRAELARGIEAIFEQELGARPPLQISFDLDPDLRQMQYVLTATSKGKSFVDPGLLGAQAIVCDVARPSDFYESVIRSENDNDIKVYEGGIMKLPGGVSFGLRNVVGCDQGTNLACLSETVVLALSQVNRNYSIGPATPLAESESVLDMATEHGFAVRVPDFGPVPSAPVIFTTSSDVAPIPIRGAQWAPHAIRPAHVDVAQLKVG